MSALSDQWFPALVLSAAVWGDSCETRRRNYSREAMIDQ